MLFLPINTPNPVGLLSEPYEGREARIHEPYLKAPALGRDIKRQERQI